MAFTNSIMNELIVPRTLEARWRIHGFYREIGWAVREDTNDRNFIYVRPLGRMVSKPIFGYWLTTNETKAAHFADYRGHDPSIYARGQRLPQLLDLVEISLVLPKDELVQELYEHGGATLAAHAHIPLREHAGAPEFRISDPFNYSLRITGDPGYQA